MMAAETTLNLWMDVMRHLEPVIADHERLFDAWAAGGVDGLVIGPMAFEENVATFDPDARIYRRLGLEPPEPPSQSLPEKRALLDRALQAAKDRGWKVWIFQPGSGAPPVPGAHGSIIVDDRARAAYCARIVDTMSHYPMVDGAVLDGPEWGYEISPEHMVGSCRPPVLPLQRPAGVSRACLCDAGLRLSGVGAGERSTVRALALSE